MGWVLSLAVPILAHPLQWNKSVSALGYYHETQTGIAFDLVYSQLLHYLLADLKVSGNSTDGKQVNSLNT